MSKSIMLMLTYVFNVADCMLTLHFNETSLTFSELNPFGRVLLDSGAFALYKIMVVGLMLGLLLRFKNNKIASVGIYVCFGVYAVLMVWWTVYMMLIK